MLKRILVPLDGSPRAERAIPVAARVAQASGGSIILVRVVTTSVEFWPSPVPQPALAQVAIDADIASAVEYLEAITQSTSLANIQTETVVLFGPTAPTILTVARSYHADIIILCSHGYTGMKRWVMGSVAQKVAQYASLPVMVLRERGSIPAAPHLDATRPLRVLVPLDGSSQAKAAIEPAASLIVALAAPASGALHLLRVVEPSMTESVEEGQHHLESYLHKAKEYLRATADHLREGLVAPTVAAHKLTVTWSVAVDVDVAGGVIRVAENGEDAEGAGVFGGCDLIALATHGRGGMQRWAMGSVAERVLGATDLPILIIRPPDTTDKQGIHDKSTEAVLNA
ncbi:MAG: universal stress protein [Ktedonobacteraceae bacterium]